MLRLAIVMVQVLCFTQGVIQKLCSPCNDPVAGENFLFSFFFPFFFFSFSFFSPFCFGVVLLSGVCSGLIRDGYPYPPLFWRFSGRLWSTSQT